MTNIIVTTVLAMGKPGLRILESLSSSHPERRLFYDVVFALFFVLVSGRVTNSILRRNVVAPSKLKTSYAAPSSSLSNPRSKYNSGTSTTVVEGMRQFGAPEKDLKIIKISNILAEETSDSVVSIFFIIRCM